MRSPRHQNRLQLRLRQIDMLTRTRRLIVALAVRIIAPAVNARKLLAGHRMAPPRVHHVVAAARGLDARLVQPNIAQALESGHVGDVGARRVGRARGRGDEDASEVVRGEEAGEGCAGRASAYY